MKNDENVIAEAIRIEYSEIDGKLFIIFEVCNEKSKKDIMENWTDDIEYKIIDKKLYLNE
jgi:hypothetical protein